jgi:hypothetical protein
MTWHTHIIQTWSSLYVCMHAWKQNDCGTSQFRHWYPPKQRLVHLARYALGKSILDMMMRCITTRHLSYFPGTSAQGSPYRVDHVNHTHTHLPSFLPSVIPFFIIIIKRPVTVKTITVEKCTVVLRYMMMRCGEQFTSSHWGLEHTYVDSYCNNKQTATRTTTPVMLCLHHQCPIGV